MTDFADSAPSELGPEAALASSSPSPATGGAQAGNFIPAGQDCGMLARRAAGGQGPIAPVTCELAGQPNVPFESGSRGHLAPTSDPCVGGELVYDTAGMPVGAQHADLAPPECRARECSSTGETTPPPRGAQEGGIPVAPSPERQGDNPLNGRGKVPAGASPSAASLRMNMRLAGAEMGQSDAVPGGALHGNFNWDGRNQRRDSPGAFDGAKQRAERARYSRQPGAGPFLLSLSCACGLVVRPPAVFHCLHQGRLAWSAYHTADGCGGFG